MIGRVAVTSGTVLTSFPVFGAARKGGGTGSGNSLVSRNPGLLHRTLFAWLRMPRVPEGASAMHGAKPEFWLQYQYDPLYTNFRAR